MTLYTDFQTFVDEVEATPVFEDWCLANGGDCDTWKAYRTDLLTQTQSSPNPLAAAPTMATRFGKTLVDVGVMALDAGMIPPPPPGPPLAADFTFGLSGLTATFHDTSQPGPSGPILAWHWDFGDGNTSSLQSPSHTYAGAGSYTVSLTVTGTSPDGTSTTTQTVTTTSPPSGTVEFDGSADLMTALFSYESTPGDLTTLHQGQTPKIWTALDFENNDIQLAADAHYGQVYKVTVPIGDSNPWNHGANPDSGAALLSIRRPNLLGQWRYFAIGARVDSWTNVAGIQFCELASLGYQTSQSSQVALDLMDNGGVLSFAIFQNAGFANNPSGYATGTTHYKEAFKPVVFGQREEFVVAVKWATDKTGEVQVWNRPVGGSWSKLFDKTGVDTYLYGTTPYGFFAQDGSNWTTVLDKLEIYYNLNGAVATETVYETGLVRCTDLATAQAQFP